MRLSNGAVSNIINAITAVTMPIFMKTSLYMPNEIKGLSDSPRGVAVIEAIKPAIKAAAELVKNHEPLTSSPP